MVVKLTPEYKFVCDRCGHEIYPGEDGLLMETTHEAKFFTDVRQVASGSVCHKCFSDFRELAENFFDEVNKHEEEKHD